MRCKGPTSTIALAVAAALTAPAALAQNSILDEITVTAQKREQTLEDVPLAVSAISGDQVNEYIQGGGDIRSLAARVPGLNIETSNGRTQPRIYLRGFGNPDFDVNAQQPVAYIFDEVALNNPTLRSLPLFDLARVEVLKGPQGSLFGRNTNAGAIKIESMKPNLTDRDRYVKGGYGSRDTLMLEGASNFAMGKNVAGRASVKYQDRDDWIDNTVNGPGDDFGGFEETAWRLQFLWEPSDNFSGYLKLHGFNQDGSSPNIFYANALEVGRAGVRPGFDEEVVTQDSGDVTKLELDHIGAALNLQWTLANGITIASVTGYDTVENFQSADVDGGIPAAGNPADGVLGESLFPVATGDGLTDHYQLTQEFRLSGESDKLFWQAGVYYFDEDFDLLNQSFTNPAETALINSQTTSLSVFGQAEYRLSDQLGLTVGGRFTDDETDLSVAPGETASTVAPDSVSVSDDFFNWDIALTYDVNDEFTVYGRVATGNRSPAAIGRFGFITTAETEDTLSVEAGFKSKLLGGRARWNMSVYSFTNDDHQLTATGGIANVNTLLNADQVDGFGIETELDLLLTDNLLLTTNLSFNDTEIDDPGLRDDLCGSVPGCTGLDVVTGTRATPFGTATEVDVNGNPLPRTPEIIFNVILEYTIPMANGEAYFNTDWNYRDDSSLNIFRSVEFVQDERWLGGLRAGYRTDSGMDFALVGRNVTDEIVVEGGINFNNLTAFVNEPAYWGAEFRYGF